MRKQFILAIFVLAMAGSVAACSNTFHGAGKDIENSGEAVQDAVEPQN